MLGEYFWTGFFKTAAVKVPKVGGTVVKPKVKVTKAPKTVAPTAVEPTAPAPQGKLAPAQTVQPPPQTTAPVRRGRKPKVTPAQEVQPPPAPAPQGKLAPAQTVQPPAETAPQPSRVRRVGKLQGTQPPADTTPPQEKTKVFVKKTPKKGPGIMERAGQTYETVKRTPGRIMSQMGGEFEKGRTGAMTKQELKQYKKQKKSKQGEEEGLSFGTKAALGLTGLGLAGMTGYSAGKAPQMVSYENRGQ